MQPCFVLFGCLSLRLILLSAAQTTAPTPAATAPTPVACGPLNFQGECATTSQCVAKYSTANDCSNSSGGVCLCGESVCGCGRLAPVEAATSTPEASPITGPTSDDPPCGPLNFQAECTTTGQCQGKYSAADDCSNSGGGVCYCGESVCGCANQPPVAAPAVTAPSTPAEAAPNVTILLVDAGQQDNGRTIAELVSGNLTVVDIDDVGTSDFAIVVVTGNEVKSLEFGNGKKESSVPFALCGDIDATGEILACEDLVPGLHTLSFTPYPEEEQSGTPFEVVTVTFGLNGRPSYTDTAASSGETSVTFVLVDASDDANGRELAVLTDGIIIDIVKVGAFVDAKGLSDFSVVAKAAEEVQSVQFDNVKKENTRPFSLCGDIDATGSILSCGHIGLGERSVTVTPFPESDLQGVPFEDVTITFELVKNEPAARRGTASAGAIIGSIIVGAVVLGILLAAAVWFEKRNRRKAEKPICAMAAEPSPVVAPERDSGISVEGIPVPDETETDITEADLLPLYKDQV